jgi:hypothetical protein
MEASLLQQILSRLTAIESAIATGGGSASSSSTDAVDCLSKLANDLDLSVFKTKGAALLASAGKLPGPEGNAVVSYSFLLSHQSISIFIM